MLFHGDDFLVKSISKFLFIIILILLLSGCFINPDNNIISTVISQIDIEKNGHIEQLHEYNSPYTIVYRNKNDIYSIYIFTSPIQYKDDNNKYKIIDNTVIESGKLGYSFENKSNDIKTYFPKTFSEPFRIEKETDILEFKPNWNVDGFSEAVQTTFTNMYGDNINAVIYSRKDMDMLFYPTKSGIKSELIIKKKIQSNEFTFLIQSNALSYENEDNGYLLLKSGDISQSIIYKPLVSFKNNQGNQMYVTSTIYANGDKGNYFVTVKIHEDILKDEKTTYPVKIDTSFEMYQNKMPDSTVYSKHDINNYLANFAVVGEHPIYGQGWHYVRFKLNYFLQVNENSIIKAEYTTKQLYLSKAPPKTTLNRASKQWSSTEMLWKDKTAEGNVIASEEKYKNGYLRFDISDYVKDCLGGISWETEDIGTVIKSENTDDDDDNYQIISTADNALYSPYIKIDFNSPPINFISQEGIK